MKIRFTVDCDRLADAKLCAGLLHPTGLQPVFRFWRSGYSCHIQIHSLLVHNRK